MKLLLDTHVLIWWDAGARLSEEAHRAIVGADQVFVSAASAWEITIKTALGKLEWTRTASQVVAESGFEELPVLLRHGEFLAQLPRHHGDPLDRILVAQATVEGLLLVTRDPVFKAYGVNLISA